MKQSAENGRYFMASVKLGPKGQIVIPKEAREMFGLSVGGTMVLLADRERGIVLQTVDKLEPVVKDIFMGANGGEAVE